MEQLLKPLVFLLILVTIIWGTIRYLRGMANFRRFDFAWYRAQFPQLVTKDRVICYKCESADIGVERKLQHTYMRSHICRRCGTTLYYSQEQ